MPLQALLAVKRSFICSSGKRMAFTVTGYTELAALNSLLVVAFSWDAWTMEISSFRLKKCVNDTAP